MQAAELTVEVVVRCPSCHSDDHQIQRRHAKDDGVVQCDCHCRRCSESFFYAVDAVGKPIRV